MVDFNLIVTFLGSASKLKSSEKFSCYVRVKSDYSTEASALFPLKHFRSLEVEQNRIGFEVFEQGEKIPKVFI
jgi:hypothetical protein